MLYEILEGIIAIINFIAFIISIYGLTGLIRYCTEGIYITIFIMSIVVCIITSYLLKIMMKDS